MSLIYNLISVNSSLVTLNHGSPRCSPYPTHSAGSIGPLFKESLLQEGSTTSPTENSSSATALRSSTGLNSATEIRNAMEIDCTGAIMVPEGTDCATSISGKVLYSY